MPNWVEESISMSSLSEVLVTVLSRVEESAPVYNPETSNSIELGGGSGASVKSGGGIYDCVELSGGVSDGVEQGREGGDGDE